MGAGGEIHLLHGMFKVASAFGIQLAALADLLGTHGGVGGDAFGFKTANLDLPRLRDPLANNSGGFAGGAFGGQLAEVNQRDFDMDVDAVKQGAGDLLAVVFDLSDGAAALPFTVSVKTAGVWVPLLVKPA